MAGKTSPDPPGVSNADPPLRSPAAMAGKTPDAIPAYQEFFIS